MSTLKPSPINTTPEIELVSWSIHKVKSELWKEETYHLVGYNYTEKEGRVSSAIFEFDKDNMIGKTKSGKTYKLCGNSGFDSDALYVWSFWKWSFWKERNKIIEDIIIEDLDVLFSI